MNHDDVFDKKTITQIERVFGTDTAASVLFGGYSQEEAKRIANEAYKAEAEQKAREKAAKKEKDHWDKINRQIEKENERFEKEETARQMKEAAEREKEQLQREQEELNERKAKLLELEAELKRQKEDLVIQEKQVKEREETLSSRYEVGYAHNGNVTFDDLLKYESEIRLPGRARTERASRFRDRMVQTMVDPKYSTFVPKNSKEYKQYREKAKKEKKNLKWTANVSGFSKVFHGVGSQKREDAREKLEQLKKTADSAYIKEYDTEQDESFWKDVAKGKNFDQGAIASSAEAVEKKVYYGGSYGSGSGSDLTVLRDKLTQVRKLGLDYSDLASTAVLFDKGSKYDQMRREKITLDDSTAIAEKSNVILDACGQTDNEIEEQKKAFESLTEKINTWRADMFKSDTVYLLDHKEMDPKTYFSNREIILRYKEQSAGLFHVMQKMKAGSVYGELLEEQRAVFDETYLQMDGLRNWFQAHVDNMKKWDGYYSAANKDGLSEEQKPKRLKRLSAFILRG